MTAWPKRSPVCGGHDDMAPTAISLFSGYGGLDIALSTVVPSIRFVGFVEREAYAAAALLARMEEQTLDQAPIWCGDVEELDPSPFLGVDWLTAGFPCQPFSNAGAKRGTSDDRWVWEYIADLLYDLHPEWVFLENVPGLATRGGLGPVLSDLTYLGYDAEWAVLGADQVGAPHGRKRLFILAHSQSERRQGREGSEERTLSEPPSTNPSVAHTRRALLEGRHNLQAESRWETSPGSEGRPAIRQHFPPGPTDLDLWARLLSEAPEAEPSLCGVAHGSTGRLDYRRDRLRAIGNGVVPLQAAVALRLLADRAGWQL